MSKTIDQRVVEMKFDNRNFENNVRETMSTLDKLKQKLNLTGASKGFENIDSSAKRINLTGLSGALDTVRVKFSALEIAGVTALMNITNSAVNAGKRLASALTIDQITAGFDKFGKKTSSVATLQAQGFALEEVNEQLERLNWFTDETSYNYTDMVENISKFTATGKGLTESVNAMEGIATWAALSGQNAQKASSAMYQLSQALGAGVMRKEDYKSIQNVSMDTDEFRQKALDAAIALGTLRKNADGTYQSLMVTGSGAEKFTKSQFAEKLTEGQWFTSDVMMKVFGEYSKAVDEIYRITEERGMLASEVIDEIHDKAKNEGISTNEAIKALGYNFDEFALKAFEAGQKARTFGDAIDATKDAVSTGWMKTFELIFGNSEQATELWTNLANALWDVFASGGEARNELLKGWNELGGRDDLIKSFWNSWEAIAGILGPIKEAFKDIFPSLTVDQLVKFTDKLEELTGNFKAFTEEHGPKIKSTFKGLFAVVDIVATVITKVASGVLKIVGSLLGFTGGLLTGTATLGDFLVKIRNVIKDSDLLGKVIDKIVSVLQNGINKVKEFGVELKEAFKTEGYKGFVGFLKGIYDFTVKLKDGVVKAISSIGQSIAKTFKKNSFLDVVDSGMLTAVMYKILAGGSDGKGFLEELKDKLVGDESVLANIKGILDDVRGCLQAYQEQLKAGTLLKIASAIGILAASLFTISTIDPDDLGRALHGITVLFSELLISMALFSKIPSMKSGFKSILVMQSMASAMLVLSAAMKIMSTMKIDQMAIALLGVAGGLTSMVIAANKLPTGKVAGLFGMATALVVFASALKIMSSIGLIEMGISLGGVVIGLTAMVVAMNKLPTEKVVGIFKIATALVIFAAALKIMSGIGLKEMAISLGAVIIGVAVMTKSMNKLPQNVKVVGLFGMATALVVLASALKIMSSMSLTEIAIGLGTVIISLIAMTKAMNKMPAKSAGLLGMSLSLVVLAGALRLLGSMKITTVGKALLTIAASFMVIGHAAKVLAPTIPALLGFAGACSLIGLSAVLLGAGLGLIASGISLLAASIAVGATGIVAGLTVIITGLLDLVPTVLSRLGEWILSICKVIGDSAPAIADALLKLLANVLASLATYTPMIANSLFDLWIGVLDTLTARMPEIMQSTAKFLNAFFVGMVDSIKSLDGANLLKGAIAVGIMTILVSALAGVSSMIGPAMIGLLGVGALLAELALVLAAIGAISKIPGLSWLIEEGGDLLGKIGTAIGQFVGGIAGGIALGFTNSLPEIGLNLSDFMKNINGFIEGAKKIDGKVVSGINSLLKAMLAITGMGFLGSFTTAGVLTFALQLIPLGYALKKYSSIVSGIDTKAISASAAAAKALTEVANAIPNTGGLISLITGDNSLLSLAVQLIPFGSSLKLYASTVSGINIAAITASAMATKELAEMCKHIPNEGGMLALFTGNNSVAKFAVELKQLGIGLREFSIETAGIDAANMTACSSAAKALAEMCKYIPNEGGMAALFAGDNSVAKFADDLETLGIGMNNFSVVTEGVKTEGIKACAEAVKVLAEMSNHIPNEGGMVALFTGDNSLSTFAGNLKPLGEGIRDFSVVTEGVKTEGINACAEAIKAIAEMSNHIPNEGGMVALFTGDNSLSTFAGNLKPLGEGIAAFSDATEEVNPENVTAAANAAKALAEMSNHIPNEGGVKGFLSGEKSFAAFADNLEPLGKGIAAFSVATEGVKPENVTAAASAAKSLGEMANVVPKKTDKIITFGTNLVSFGEKLKSYFTKIGEISEKSITKSDSAIKTVQTVVKDFDSKSITSVSTSIDKLVKSLKSMSKISESTVKGFSSAIKTLGQSNVTALIEAFTYSEVKLKSAGEQAIKRLVEGINSQKDETSKAFKNLKDIISKAPGEIKEYKDDFYKAGSHLVTGFVNGIGDNTYKAKAKALAMAKAAKLAAEKELDINSPSKVFYAIGSFVTQGFVNALSDGERDVYSASGSMAESARKGIHASIGKVVDLMNSNMDTQPTIRPVLDLSDIESGVGSINTMFNNGPSLGVAANLKAINSGMNSRSQNGANYDVVAAINKLGRNLGNVSGDTYNINGVSYDEESGLADAVRTIIRAAKVERRS